MHKGSCLLKTKKRGDALEAISVRRIFCRDEKEVYVVKNKGKFTRLRERNARDGYVSSRAR